MPTLAWQDEHAIGERRLLQCVVEVARMAFRAEAASVFLVDDETGELVFEAVAGRGEDHLVGTRFSEGTGLAGWVAACGQPVLADDLSEAPFSRSAAEQTGFMPRTVAAAPLFVGGTCIGVLEVLDRSAERDEMEAQELLGLLATQAAAGVELVRTARRTRREAPGTDAASNAAVIDQICAKLPSLDPTATRLLGQVLALADGLTGLAASRSDGADHLQPGSAASAKEGG